MSIVLDGTTGITTPALDSVAKFASADMPLGSVLQVVSVTKSDTFSSAGGATYADITGLSASITPTSASSKILVISSTNVGATTGLYQVYTRLMRDSTAIGIGDAAGSRPRATSSSRSYSSDDYYQASLSATFLDAPASTAALTYKMQIATQAGGTGYVNRGQADNDIIPSVRPISTLTVMEIAA